VRSKENNEWGGGGGGGVKKNLRQIKLTKKQIKKKIYLQKI
jgi:hypothetical protein